MLKRFGLGFGIGYVLGARAGKERYEQLAGGGRQITESLGIAGLVDRLPSASREALDRLRDEVRERVGSSEPDASGQDEDSYEEDEDAGEQDEDAGEPADRARSGEDEPRAARRGTPSRGRARREPRAESSRQERGEDRNDKEKPQKRHSLASSVAGIASAAVERGRVA